MLNMSTSKLFLSKHKCLPSKQNISLCYWARFMPVNEVAEDNNGEVMKALCSHCCIYKRVICLISL